MQPPASSAPGTRPHPPVGRAFTVVIPAYNEERGLKKVVGDLKAALARSSWASEILVVDDGSTDATALVATAAGVRLVKHDTNLGYGSSLKTGIRLAQHDRIVIADADGTYPMDRVFELVEALEEADMVVAARISERVHVPLLRRPAKWCLRKLAEYLCGSKIPDLNSGLRCFRQSDVEAYMHVLPRGFSFTTTLTIAYLADSRRVRYLPVDYARREGASKISALRDTYQFLLLILRTIMYFDPMRVLMPAALASLGMTVVTFAYELLVIRNLAEKSLIWLMITIFLFSSALLGDLIVRRSR